jgi:glycosyltransferase involved in cell wall biosynthesis
VAQSLKIVLIGSMKGEGGIQAHMAGLSRQLLRRGHDVKILRTSTLIPVAATLRYMTRLTDRVDIVHVQGLQDMPSLAASCIAGRTYVGGSLATAMGSGESYWRKSHLNYVTRRSILRRFDTVISVSNYLERRMVKLVGNGPPRHRTIYNGVDTELFRPSPDHLEAKRRLGLEGKHVLLCVARLSREKGLTTLISSLPIIRQGIPNARLLICGKGDMDSQLRTLSHSLGVDEIIEFRGSVPQNKIQPYYDAADVVLVPSMRDAFPIVNLEAMSMMRPVVASKVGGIPEVVKNNETGVLVPPSDPSSLAEAVLKLYGDPEMGARLGRNGRRCVEERFTWDRIAGEFESAYHDVLNN